MTANISQRQRAFIFKRLFDLLICLPAFLFFFPAYLLITLLICLDSKGCPFYNQERVGYLSRPFKMYKFRTMYQERSGVILGLEVLPGDDRITRVGRVLRRFKLDETPQLFNVVLGHVSLVGPRPDIPAQVAAYTPFQRQRLSVLPGLTGVAQVSGNIWLPWSDRIILDVWYIENWSLWLDLKIIWQTFRVMLHGEQPSADPFGVRQKIL